ncbi:Uncharacterised protein [Mycobacteroides abscessus subsp. abscessus]|uniref:hypothetical protein n=1 Tax=Mycobacteroides abscessus TaxID=36809 RepID=UPI0009A650D0|nr:hypothetical protein [Mycobacteroides abscessus]SLJ23931.1 Uncharacterised protein [Mycobacteroides abscessus subsp. abscessus]
MTDKCTQCDRDGRQVVVPGTDATAVLCHIHHRQLWYRRLSSLARSGADLTAEPVHVQAAVQFLRSEEPELDLHTAEVWAQLIGYAVDPAHAVDFVRYWFRRVRGGLRRGPARFRPREQPRRGVGVPVPWPITAVESLGGTRVRISHRDGVVADHDLSYLLGKSGVFAALTAEIIAAATVVDDTVGFHMPDGTVLDLAPDAIYEHAVDGRCTGSCGWRPEHTTVVVSRDMIERIDRLIEEEAETLAYIEAHGDGDPHEGMSERCPDCGWEPGGE